MANKLNLISYDGEHNFNLTDPKGLISDEEQEIINKEAHPLVYGDILIEFLKTLTDKKNSKKTLSEAFDRGELREAYYWLNIDKYERKEINKFLTLYAKGDERWQEAFDEVIYL